MATYNRATSRLGGLSGYPALIFIEINQYGAKEQTYQEMRMRQHKIYSYLRAYLPELYDKDGKREDYNLNIAPLLDEAAMRIEITRDLYRSTFEGVHTWTQDEAEFQTSLDSSFEHLNVITAKSKAIDTVKPEEELVMAG
jgi:hypothetical protein